MPDYPVQTPTINQLPPIGMQEHGNALVDLANDYGVPGGSADANQVRAAARAMDDAAALEYTHPDYDANVKKWEKYIDLYCAHEIYNYIYKHPRETTESWEARVGRAYLYNYASSVVDLFVSYLFSVNIVREETSDENMKSEIQTVLSDADMKGTTYDVFIRTAATFAQVMGWVGVLVDAPSIDTDNLLSERDRKDKGIRPFLKMILPMHLLDWAIDDFGKFLWVKIEVPVFEESRTFKEKVDGAERRFLIWNRDGWELWSVIRVEGMDPIVKKIREGVSPTDIKGTVPFTILRNAPKCNHDWMGESALRDIADINIALMNWSSLGDEEIANRCLNILTMEKDNTNQVGALLSHANILEYATGAKPPAYLTPGSTPLDLIGQWIDRARDEIYRIAKVGGSTGLLGVREATSGIAYAYEFNETNQSLTAKASYMEMGETEVFRLVCRWLGGEYTGTVSYSRDFGVDDFLLELDTIMRARSALTAPTAIKQMEKNLCNKLFARRPLDFRKKIEQEIDEAPEQNLATVGSFDSISPALVGGPKGTGRDSSGN
jgi:hypothetical protein